MATKVEIVGDADSHAVAKVAFQRQICLLRIGINEIIALRITKRLEAERQESAACKVEIILIEEN